MQDINGTATEPSLFSSPQSFAASTNRFLRSRSKLYLYLKDALTDPAGRYFKQDLAEYERRHSNIDAALRLLRQIAQEMAANGIIFEVFVMPYEAQLRRQVATDFLLPQTLVDDFLERNKITYFDAFAAFRRAAVAPESLYLYGDPMHLSAEGNRIAFQFVETELKNMMAATRKSH